MKSTHSANYIIRTKSSFARMAIRVMTLSAVVPLCCSIISYAQRSSVPVNREAVSEQCQESLSIVRAIGDELREPKTVAFFVEDPPELGPRERYITEGTWIGQAPSSDLRAVLKHDRRRSVMVCTTGKVFDGRPIIDSDEERRIRSNSAPNSSNWFIRVGMPVTDRTGHYALFVYESNGASFGGHAEAYYLERGDAGWEVIGRNILSMS